jgi:hypothetical protein
VPDQVHSQEHTETPIKCQAEIRPPARHTGVADEEVMDEIKNTVPNNGWDNQPEVSSVTPQGNQHTPGIEWRGHEWRGVLTAFRPASTLSSDQSLISCAVRPPHGMTSRIFGERNSSDAQPSSPILDRGSRPRHRRICGDAGGDLGTSGWHCSSRRLEREYRLLLCRQFTSVVLAQNDVTASSRSRPLK